MASVEFIEKRIASKEKEIATLSKKLDRIYKAKESNWEKNPYYYSEYDLTQTLKDIDTAKKSLEKYQADLATEIEKNNSRDVQVILDFLAAWKDRVFTYYSDGLVEYYKDSDRVRQLAYRLNQMEYETPYNERDYELIKSLRAEYDEVRTQFRINCKGQFEDIPKDSPSYSLWNRQRKVADGKYEWLRQWTAGFSTLEEATANLDKVLTREAQLKYDDLVHRCNKIVALLTIKYEQINLLKRRIECLYKMIH